MRPATANTQEVGYHPDGMASFFQYQPLRDPSREIRLLRFVPGDELSCEISNHRFESAPTYRAISYTWGEATPLHSILVDRRSFMVRRNCLCVLRQAHRHLPVGTHIWIDAICINQEDNEEKNHQVAMMGELYHQAESVFVSIGESLGDSAFLFQMATYFLVTTAAPRGDCRTCDNFHQGRDRTYSRIWQGELHAYHSWIDNVGDKGFGRLHSAYHNFAGRPYWRRVWIIQEILQARQIQLACGQHIGGLAGFLFINRLLHEAYFDRDVLFPGRVPASIQLRFELGFSEFEPDYFSFLWTRYGRADGESRLALRGLSDFVPFLAAYHCAEIRDRIYGLLGLVDWGPMGDLRPDYTIEPLALALQVMQRMSAAKAQGHFYFPDKVSDLLRALEVRSIGSNRLTKHFTMATGSQKQSSSQCCKCKCKVPTSPQISFIHDDANFTCRDLRSATELQGTSLENEQLQQSPRRQRSPLQALTAKNKRRSQKSFILAWLAKCKAALTPHSSKREQVGLNPYPSLLRKAVEQEPRAVESYAWARPEKDRPLSAWHEAHNLLYVYDLRQDDILLWPARLYEGRPTERIQDVAFCLVLRHTHDGYFEILDEAPKVSEDFFDPGHPDRPPLWLSRKLWLCLDLRDAVSLTLSLDRLEARVRAGEAVDEDRHSLRVRTHFRPKMTSYAVVKDKDEPLKVMGAPSTDGKSLPCARCGGLLQADEEIVAEHARERLRLAEAIG